MAQVIRSLISFGILLYAASIWAGTESIYGDWEAGGRATEAIFGTMTITKTHLSWQGKAMTSHVALCVTSRFKRATACDSRIRLGQSMSALPTAHLRLSW